MTLPITTIFPLPPEGILDNGDGFAKYMRELVFTMQRQYEDTAQAVNGDIRSDVEQASRQFTPTISGGTAAGVGTYVADHQTGWVLRKGLIVDFWFDIGWTAHTGTGSMLVNLPYEVADSLNAPFVGVLMAQNITFTGFLTGTAVPGTRGMEIIDTRSATTWNNITVTNANTTLRGHVRYIGKAIERN